MRCLLFSSSGFASDLSTCSAMKQFTHLLQPRVKSGFSSHVSVAMHFPSVLWLSIVKPRKSS